MKDWDDLFDELEGLTEEEIEILEEQFREDLEESSKDFEIQFYVHVCGSEDFQVLAIPDSDGYVPTKEEIDKVRKHIKALDSNLIYRVSHGAFATVYGPKTGKVGVMPEDNSEGFNC